MKKLILCIGALVTFLCVEANAQNKHAKETMYPSYKGLIMAGYQGWFRAPGDEINSKGYGHWGRGDKFDEVNCTVDAWPDVSEYEKTYPTKFKLADGSTARVFSSVDKSTSDLHFKWMKEYGLDGVFMQRFYNDATSDMNSGPNVVLKNALESASKYGRAIGVMYDLSGLPARGKDCSALIEDWKFLVDQMKVTNQSGEKTYIFHNGKPLVTIWGVGFPDRAYDIRDIGVDRFIDFLKNDPEYGGCSVMLGVPTYWREQVYDCVSDPYLQDLIKQCDIIMPWMVQRFSPMIHFEEDRYRDMVLADIKKCREYGIDYAPNCSPGFSWHNMQYGRPNPKPLASIPRLGGEFFWMELSQAINAGAEMIYVAMFDEVDEGTAVFKITNEPPVSDIAGFITTDGKPSDHYLWLIGEASQMLKGKKPLSLTMPERK